jgi:DNA (cytosine-5)-methyltransferase 1
MSDSRFLYDKKDASFVDLPPPSDAHAASEPPHNCAICVQREEEEMQAQGRIIRRTGSVTGVAVHGATFHVGDFALLRAEEGPARIGQITGLFSGSPVWIKVQLLGRVSDLVDLLPADELQDEVRFFLIPPHLTAQFTYSFFPSTSVICSSRMRPKRYLSTTC